VDLLDRKADVAAPADKVEALDKIGAVEPAATGAARRLRNQESQRMEAEITQAPLSAAPDRSEVASSTAKAGLAVAGGVLGALAALSCCVAPLVLFTLGIGGTWISNLTALELYQPIFFAATAGFLGVGYYLVYLRPKVVCIDGTCTRSLPGRIIKAVLWAATVLVLAAAGTAMATERTVTLAVKNMYLFGLPLHHRQEPKKGCRRRKDGGVLREEDRDRDL
jgi:mercuric ion transport protein